MSLTNTLKSINRTKQNLLDDGGEIDCPPYIVNTVFTGFLDTVHIAEMVSMVPNLADQEVYLIYLGLVRKRSRFKRMNFKKRKTDANILEFCKKYQISTDKYMSVRHILKEDY